MLFNTILHTFLKYNICEIQKINNQETVLKNEGTSGEEEQKSLFFHCSEGTKKVPIL